MRLHRTGSIGGALGSALDGALDLAVVLVAWWTLLYWAFWAAHASLWTAGWLWVVGSVVLVVGYVLLARRTPEETGPGQDDDTASTVEVTGLNRWLTLGAAGCAVLAALWSAVVLDPRFPVVWLLAVAGLGLGVAAGAVGRTAPLAPARDLAVAGWQHLVAAALALGVAVLSLYIHLPDLDDPYYVNRSVWIADHGTSMVRDTMFGPGTYVSPYNGGIPIASFEGLIGALAHLTGLQVGTLTWVVTTFVGALMAVWVLWLLARTWATRGALLVAVVAVAFMLMGGDSRLGNFWIARMWQGKVLAIAVLMPLAWVWATRAIDRPGRRPLVMLLVGGVAFAGLTSTSVILAPLLAGAMVVSAAFLRSRRLAVGGVLFLVGPVLSGLAVIAFSGKAGGLDPTLLSGSQTFVRVLGSERVMYAVAVLAIVLGPLLVRRRSGRLMTGWVSLAALVMLVPPLLHAANDVTGAGPILWRVLYCAPIAVLVGLLAVPPVPGRLPDGVRRLVSLAAPVVVLLVVAAFGAPLWTTVDHNGPVTLSASPSWKVDTAALADVRRVVDTTRPTGVVLLPPNQMKILSMFTTKAFAVDPRDWYARTLVEPSPRGRWRLQLKTMAQNTGPLPSQQVTTQALRTLRVTEVCVIDQPFAAPRVLERRALITRAGYTQRSTVGRLTCYRPAG